MKIRTVVLFELWQCHSDLSDQSAVEIRVRIRVRLRVALFQHFSRRITKNEHLIFANFAQGNILLKTLPNDQQQNKITYSRRAY